MCGRFTLKTPPSEWISQLFPNLELLGLGDDVNFSTTDSPKFLTARYNIAPTQTILTLVAGDGGKPIRVTPMRWGLLPRWAKDRSMGARMINARSETATEKASFRDPMAKQRCLIVADGYYEWQTDAAGAKQPFWIHPARQTCFLMAGLWDTNQRIDPENPILSATILTIAASPSLASLHERMPAILPAENASKWLDAAMTDPAVASKMLQTAEDDFFETRAVSRFVNNARNESPACLEP
jgi:putative SOS response-associated peptidase YedK